MTANKHSSWLRANLRMMTTTSVVGVILLLNLMVSVDLARAFYEIGEDKLYDPEHNSDGIIPELQGNNLMLGASPKQVRWNYDDHHDDDQHEVMPVRQVARRSDGSDIDDDEDEERDEDKSGSSQHGQYAESPAYGESPRAAQDGEDIENFFDTHLGPQDSHDEPAQTDSSNQVLAAVPAVQPLIKRSLEHRVELAERRPDLVGASELGPTSDPYEGAASSPLADMIHSLIRHHRRPIVIEQMDQDDSQTHSGPSATTQTEANKAPVPAITSGLGVEQQPLSLASHQLAGVTIVRGSPFLDVSNSPMAAATSSAYDGTPTTSSMEDQREKEQEQQQQTAHELYMSAAGRPYYATAAASNGNIMGGRYRVASWPTTPSGGVGPQPPVSGWRRPDYSASYTHQRQQPIAAKPLRGPPTTAAAEEPETMSFGLSFGGASSLLGGEGATGISASTDSSLQQAEDVAATAGEEPASVGQPTEIVDGDASSQDEHQHQQQWHPITPMAAGYGPQQHSNYNQLNYHQNYAPSQSMARYQQQQMRQFQQQQPYLASERYRAGAKEQASESAANAWPAKATDNNYDNTSGGYHQQYRRPDSSSNSNRKNQENSRWVTRQELLAAVDRQIKSNPYYQQQQQQQQLQLSSNRKVSASEFVRSKVSAKVGPTSLSTADTNDLDSYKSFHAESDPYSSFTASSQIVNNNDDNNNNKDGSINEPQTDNTQIKGSHKAPMEGEFSSNRTAGELEQYDESAVQQQHQVNQVNSRGLTDQVVSATQVKPVEMPPQHQHARAPANHNRNLSRVKREDADERENEEADDDGVWVDDDEDDDNRQTASDLNETTSEVPEGEEETEAEAEADTTDANDAANQRQVDHDPHQPRQIEIYHPNQGMMAAGGPPPPGMIGHPHGYEIVG